MSGRFPKETLLASSVVPAQPGHHFVSVSPSKALGAIGADNKDEHVLFETIIAWHIEVYRREDGSRETFHVVNPVLQTGDDAGFSGESWAYLSPDGRLTNMDGWWPDLGSFLVHVSELHREREENKAKIQPSHATPR